MIDPDTSGARAAVVVLAAGSGTRVGAEVNKVLLPLRRRPGARLVGADRAGAARTYAGVVVVRARRASARPSRGAVGAPPRRRARCCVVDRRRRPGTPRSGRRSGAAPTTIEAGDDRRRRDARRRPPAGRTRPVRARRWPRPREHGGAIPVVPLDDLLRRDGAAVAERAGRRADPAGLPRRRPARGLPRGRRRRLRGHRHRGLRRARTPRCAVAAVAPAPANLKITFPEDLALADGCSAGRVSASSTRDVVGPTRPGGA